MAEMLLATIRTVKEQHDDLLYALKAVAAELSRGQHFPEMYDRGGQDALLTLVLSAIAIADQPFGELKEAA